MSGTTSGLRTPDAPATPASAGSMYKTQVKLRFTSSTPNALARQLDMLINLKFNGHASWNIGTIMFDSDGASHFDVVSFHPDPLLSIPQLTPYHTSDVMIDDIPVDVRPGEPVTTPRSIPPTVAQEMIANVLSGQDANAVVDTFVSASYKKE